ncbi:MAG: hypothetical protein QQN63_00190 [Nitrosopumilus sp.]
MSKLGLYKFFMDYGRMGELDGLFFCTPELIDEAMGHEIYLGEVLGKHSDVFFTLEADMIELITDDERVMVALEPHRGAVETGYNPIEYYMDQKEDT